MRPPSEAGFLRAVIELARLRGWRVFHVRPGRTIRGWRTPLQGDGVGWPDLFLVRRRDGRALAVEIKTDRGRLTDAQKEWLDDLSAARIPAAVWRPRDWDLIARELE